MYHDIKQHKPKVIIHIDGDAFFASVEQAKNWRLKGKPVVTGGERYIASAMSYEAKRKGVTRGMKKQDILRVCPDALFIPSDYATYAIFARRMYNIVRTYTPIVEEYSIDECFADITGLDSVYQCTYQEIALRIKNDLERKLGITFGVGVAETKVLAKIASKQSKPAGLVCLHDDISSRTRLLMETPIERVWGIGSSATRLLRSQGIMTAYQFMLLDSFQIKGLNLAKPYRHIHTELHGISVLDISTMREVPKSIMSSRSFAPQSRDISILYSHLSRHVEEVCEKMREIKVRAKEYSFYIKDQDFRYSTEEYRFDNATDNPLDLLVYIRDRLPYMIKSHTTYRTTGVMVRGLCPVEQLDQQKQNKSLFSGESDQKDSNIASVHSKRAQVFSCIDAVNKKYGTHTIMLGSSLSAVAHFDNEQKRLNQAKKVWELPLLGTIR